VALGGFHTRHNEPPSMPCFFGLSFHAYPNMIGEASSSGRLHLLLTAVMESTSDVDVPLSISAPLLGGLSYLGPAPSSVGVKIIRPFRNISYCDPAFEALPIPLVCSTPVICRSTLFMQIPSTMDLPSVNLCFKKCYPASAHHPPPLRDLNAPDPPTPHLTFSFRK